jgi:hypothetical protein
MFTAARLAVGGAVVAHAVGALLDLVVLGPVGAVAGLALGHRLIRIERGRQVEQRRQLARQELRRYVDEVGFVVGNDSRDAVRRAQRHLRDEFASRALAAQRSSAQALTAVRRSGELPAAERAGHARELDHRARALDEVGAQLARAGGAP